MKQEKIIFGRFLFIIFDYSSFISFDCIWGTRVASFLTTNNRPDTKLVRFARFTCFDWSVYKTLTTAYHNVERIKLLEHELNAHQPFCWTHDKSKHFKIDDFNRNLLLLDDEKLDRTNRRSNKISKASRKYGKQCP